VADRSVRPSAEKARNPIPFGDAAYETDFNFQRFFMDILGDHAVANALAHLVDGQHTEVRGLAFSTVRRPQDSTPDLGFEFRLRRDGHTQAWAAFGLGSVGYTVSRVRLDVEPVRLPQPLYRSWKE
jgi:cyanophycinase